MSVFFQMFLYRFKRLRADYVFDLAGVVHGVFLVDAEPHKQLA